MEKLIYQGLYALFALGAVAGGLNVVGRRSPVNSAISLLFTFICVASLYIMHGSPLLAMIQIIIYAGAILILVVFTIMLLALRDPGRGLTRLWTHAQKVAALIAAGVLGLQLVYLGWQAVHQTAAPSGVEPAQLADPASLGHLLFEKYLLPFEVAGVLLLVAILGAVALTRRPAGTAAAVDAPHADHEPGGEAQS